MFWFWAFASMFGYAVQNALLAKHVRNMDALSAGFYRNISFVVSFAPLLFFVPWEAYSSIVAFLPLIIFSAFLAAISLWTRFLTWNCFPLGIGSGAIMGFNVLLSWLFAWCYLREVLSWPTVLALMLILSGSFGLALSKSEHLNLEKVSVKKGFALILGTSILISTAFILIAGAARGSNPLLVAYAWEVLIAPGILLIIGVRSVLGKGKGLEKISWSLFHKILWCSAPTAIGTAGYALAVQTGPVAITAAISATGVFVISGFGVLFYDERLKPVHVVAMVVTVLGVIGLRLFV